MWDDSLYAYADPGISKRKYQNAATYGDRQKTWAKLFLAGQSVDAIAASYGRTRRYVAREICFGAQLLRDEDVRARQLHELFRQPGNGVIKALKKFGELDHA